MKRWLLVVVLSLVVCPSFALAQPIDRGSRLWPTGRPPMVLEPLPALTLPSSLPYGGEVLQGARYLGPAQLGTIGLDVGMRMRDERGLLQYARLASDPHSVYYRHFLTPQQLADDFGASPTDYKRAIQYFAERGLLVEFWAQRQMLHVVGVQSNVEAAFATRFGWFQKNGVTFYAPVTPPRLQVPLSVRGIGGMVTYHRLRRHYGIGMPFRPASGIGPGFLLGNSPFDLAAAFDYTGAYILNNSCCKGNGITIGVVGTGPISSADVPLFFSTYGVAGTGSLNQVNVTAVAPGYSSGLHTPPPVTGFCSQSIPPNYNACNPEDIEAQLDTEQTRSLAPNAMVNFYLAFNPNECFRSGTCPPGTGVQALGIEEADDELQQVINDNVADVVTGSYGVGELDFAGQSGGLLNSDGTGIEPTIFASLAAEGIAVFFSAGDSGAEGCQADQVSSSVNVLCVSYPSADPNVVSMGGTTTPISSNGRLSGLITTWGVQTQSGGATGGGFSTVFARPAYQPSGMFCADKADSNGKRCDSTHRLQPDISLNSDLTTGDVVIINAGPGLGGALIGAVGGTSAAAPGMAAMWSLVLEACKETPSCATHGAAFGSAHPYRLGNPAPLLYGLSPANRASAFYDVVYGSNAVPAITISPPTYSNLDPGFHAGVGYDAATGLGAPFARNLIKAIVGL